VPVAPALRLNLSAGREFLGVVLGELFSSELSEVLPNEPRSDDGGDDIRSLFDLEDDNDEKEEVAVGGKWCRWIFCSRLYCLKLPWTLAVPTMGRWRSRVTALPTMEAEAVVVVSFFVAAASSFPPLMSRFNLSISDRCIVMSLSFSSIIAWTLVFSLAMDDCRLRSCWQMADSSALCAERA
jgi:hypothetical protein